MKPIKIAQLGVSHEHAAGKMRSLRLRPDAFEIVGVVDDRATTRAANYIHWDKEESAYEGLPRLTEEELFAMPGLDAVAVEVPNSELVPAANRCLAHNLPIHMDKPGGEELAPFARLRRDYEARGLAFQMGYMFRGNPAMRWILDATKRGWLGEIFEVQASMSHNYGNESYEDYIGKFQGGLMFNLGCHLVDFVVSLLGRPSGVFPLLKTAPGDKPGIHNNCVSILDYPNATVTLRACSREVGGLERRRLKICGTKGSVELCPLERFDGQPLQMSLVLLDGNEEREAGAHTLDFGPVRDRYEDQLLEFAQTIRGETKSPASPDILLNGNHDCLVQEVLLAASGYAVGKPQTTPVAQ
ncbi:putative dehydrogenase [Ereboglobus sp. PH5-10]|uniref:Gfo/Idh/MocA family protein n=1 Tax=Ereboglobus sp. PH5-10 TaxID=2940629 RepID=UPI0024053E83|nr:Gfo/Idh/MocA family oxidoreductase [Ereboglobus sp. PH5-10]MDF9826170.1 putative dehydrogenase [Ereboglobus sp. PH5-10]